MSEVRIGRKLYSSRTHCLGCGLPYSEHYDKESQWVKCKDSPLARALSSAFSLKRIQTRRTKRAERLAAIEKRFQKPTLIDPQVVKGKR